MGWGRTAAVLALLAAGCDADEGVSPRAVVGATAPTSAAAETCVLLFSRTEGFRHGSIDQAVPALQALGQSRGWMVDATEDPTAFTADNLAQYDVVVFLLTTGDVLDAEQESAFEAFMTAGGGYVGVHSATDTEYDWMFYGDMVGAYFDGHPAPQDATITVIDGDHPSTQHLGATWDRFDEWYDFSPNPVDTVDVLLNLEESTYDGGNMGPQHPIAWSREFGEGRVFYTGGGHTAQSYADADFLTHLQGGIEWAAGGEDGVGTTGGTGGAGGSTGSDSAGPSTSTSASSTSGAPTGGNSSESGASSDGTGGSSPPPATDTDEAGADSDSDAGCGCTSRPGRPTTVLSLAALVLLFRRRRS